MTDLITSAITPADADGTSPDVAPEKIWASCQIQHVGNRNNYHNGWDEKPETLLHEEWAQEPTEYIRLDLHTEALAAERVRADAAYALGVEAACAAVATAARERKWHPANIEDYIAAIRALAALETTQPPAALEEKS